MKYKICFILPQIPNLLRISLADNERYNDGYVEEKLKYALTSKMKDIEEKNKLALQAKYYFGEEMFKKLQSIDATRNDALSFNQGEKTLSLFRNII